MRRAGPVSAVAVVLLVVLGAVGAAAESLFSDGRPITILVYTKPGGAIDLTARVVATIGKKYVDVPIVVDNKSGAGGIVAINYFLQKPADGRTILGLTSSVISSATQFRQTAMLDRLDFLVVMANDYECLITSREQDGLVTFEQIVENAKTLNGKQLWAGPGIAGTDHIFAMKVWKAAGIKGKWIPYNSGAKAVMALMGKHCAVYVGNPADTIGRESLYVAATASPERYPEYPDTPTFRELGYDGLTGEILWRGFALNKGTPPAARAAVLELLRKVSVDPEWLEFAGNGQVEPVFLTGPELEEMVAAQVATDAAFIEEAGFKNVRPDPTAARRRVASWLIAALVLGAGSLLAYRSGKYRTQAGVITVALALGLIGIQSLVTASDYALATDNAFNAATTPRIWGGCLLLLSAALIAGILRAGRRTAEPAPFPTRVALMAALTFGYLFLVPVLGYLLVTPIFLVAAGLMMSYRKLIVLLPAICGWLAFVYLVFFRVLRVPLPMWGEMW